VVQLAGGLSQVVAEVLPLPKGLFLALFRLCQKFPPFVLPGLGGGGELLLEGIAAAVDFGHLVFEVFFLLPRQCPLFLKFLLQVEQLSFLFSVPCL
jgi:hypothetical protein